MRDLQLETCANRFIFNVFQAQNNPYLTSFHFPTASAFYLNDVLKDLKASASFINRITWDSIWYISFQENSQSS
jgi:hypothetical protein